MKRIALLILLTLVACSTPQTTPASFFEDEAAPATPAFNLTLEPATPTLHVATQATLPALAGSIAETGELYFFLQPRLNGGGIELVKVSATCIANPNTCPPMEKIPVPFAFNFTINALAWSPDGKYAAFSYSNQPYGSPTQLWLFEAETKIWQILAEFPYIDPPYWSPDGSWIAFRTQDGMGEEDVFIIRPNGADLQSISKDLPVTGRPYIMDGWYTENVIMRSALPGAQGTLYLVRAANGQARPMFETLLTKAQFIASPDGGFFAYDEYDYNSQNHFIKVMEPDAANGQILAQFTSGSIYPMLWSPDSRLLAFNYYSNLSNGAPIAEVYTVLRTGGELRSVYKGNTVGRLLFSPHSAYLVIEETTSASGGHLFWVDLATLQVSLLQAPGLTTDYDWYAPSWRPQP